MKCWLTGWAEIPDFRVNGWGWGLGPRRRVKVFRVSKAVARRKPDNLATDWRKKQRDGWPAEWRWAGQKSSGGRPEQERPRPQKDKQKRATEAGLGDGLEAWWWCWGGIFCQSCSEGRPRGWRSRKVGSTEYPAVSRGRVLGRWQTAESYSWLQWRLDRLTTGYQKYKEAGSGG